jgi:hypothetical protein
MRRPLDNRITAPHEFLLIRVGHHLWRELKSRRASNWGQEALSAALKTVWDAKEAVRVPLRAEYLAMRGEQAKRLLETRRAV